MRRTLLRLRSFYSISIFCCNCNLPLRKQKTKKKKSAFWVKRGRPQRDQPTPKGPTPDVGPRSDAMAPRHGIASDIREQREGAEEYDLAGYDGAAVEELVHAAFSSPIDATGPLRCTFIVGGGKKVRQKYPDSLAREMQRALQSLNFEEDRGASMVGQMLLRR